MKMFPVAVVLALSAWVNGQVTILPADVTVIEGNDAEFTCSPLSNTTLPVLQIRPDSGSTFENIEASDPRLSFEDSDDGRTYTYSNLQRDEDGTQFTCSVIGIPANTPVTIAVYFPPSFTDPGVQSVVEGMDIAVTLTVDARPVDLTEVNLTRPGGGDVPGDTMYDADSVLFVDVQRADAGEYTLTSSNAAGLGSGSFTLDVQYAPAFTGGSGNMNRAVMVGGTITLSCAAMGNPAPSVTFITTPSPDPHSATESNGVLTITNATDEPGPVVYTCIAINPHDIIDTLSYVIYTGVLPTISNLAVEQTGNTVTISWSFTDGGMPREFLTFELVFESAERTVTINRNAPNTGTTFSVGVDLEERTTYTLTVTASNLLGAGSQAAALLFMTATVTSSNNIAAIVGGVVAVVALFVIGIIVMTVLVLRYRSKNRRADHSLKRHESMERSTNIAMKENVAYSVRMQHPRSSLPTPPVVVTLQAEGRVPQDGVYDYIPGEHDQPTAINVRPLNPDTSYEIMNPCGSDEPPDATYNEISREESR